MFHQKHGDEGFAIVPYRLFAIINHFIIHNGGYTFLFFPSPLYTGIQEGGPHLMFIASSGLHDVLLHIYIYI